MSEINKNKNSLSEEDITGKYICKKCGGKGVYFISPEYVEVICLNCRGTGFFNWIEIIFEEKLHSPEEDEKIIREKIETILLKHNKINRKVLK
ncbi:MAG: hypothetical protein BWY04_00494 [candidate division CPR1 bacterium ADurb.Bin160]|uniref:Uncharacterized protein n=1 Tax=candidate division CPR1 bacterium ADurb.Bin160 TaxID=1852826 RepID=A0A1V5ZPL5_9BACT|nr:MAG: hypothetical protein BWY04_00494 [candidate division CPR1 bacterium ADurb.Bin160]